MMSTRWIIVSFYALVFCIAGCENKNTKPSSTEAQPAAAKPDAPAQARPEATAQPKPEKPEQVAKKPDIAQQAGSNTSDAPKTPKAPEPTKPATPVVPASSGPQWKLDKDTIDFGTVWAGAQITKEYHFKNVGGQTLEIIEIKPHCSCSAAENYTKQVPPGGEGMVPFRLKTDNKHGAVREYLDVTTNDPSHKVMRLWLTGNVTQVCQVEVIEDSLYEKQRAAGKTPAQFPTRSKGNFGRIEADTEMRRVVKIINTSGTNPLSLTLLPLLKNKNFEVDIQETVPGQEWQMTITGHGPWAEGYTSVPARFRTNINEQPFYRVYMSAQLPPRIEVRPRRVVIDRKWIKAQERLIQIINNGDTPLHITSIETTEPRFNLEMMPSDYETSKTYRFKMIVPTEDYVPPPYGEIIRIHTDDAEKPVIDLLVLPTLGDQPTPRPADSPLTFYPGKMAS